MAASVTVAAILLLLLSAISSRSLADETILITLPQSTVATVGIFGTTGTPCLSNSTCTGPNEYCNFLTDFDSPCQHGLCECLPCHGLDRNGICASLTQLQLGDACFGERNEAIVVEHAACFLGVVSCKSGFTQNGAYCGDDGGYPYNAACQSSYYCAGDMKCLNGTCSCIGGGQYKFDPETNACIFKQLDDYCDTDDDCQIGGTMWIGFTADRAVCLNNKCSCGEASRRTTVAHVDPTTGRLKTKQICVHSNGSVALTYGSTCDLDPVLGGTLEDVQVCDTQFVCIRCPEDDVAGHKGRCRSPVMPLPSPPVCYQRIKQPVEESDLTVVAAPSDLLNTAADTAENEIVVTLTSEVSLATKIDPNPDTWSWSDRLMAAVVNRTWFNNGWPYRQCSSPNHCYTNEQCLVPNFCQRGVCACIPPNYQDNEQNCLTPPSTGPTTTSTTPTLPALINSDESGTIIFSDSNISESTSSQRPTTAYHPPNDDDYYYYGMECQSVADCGRIGLNCRSSTIINGLVQNGLHCLTNGTGSTNNANTSTPHYCLCPSAKYKWDQFSFKCKEREFGDSCSADSDCDTGAYTKQATGGFKCLTDMSTCGCNEPLFTPVTVAVLQAAWGVIMPRNMPLTISRKTYCVASASHQASVLSGGNCTISLAETDSDSATYTCASGLVCLSCPADTFFGMCTSLASILDTTRVKIITAEEPANQPLNNHQPAIVHLHLWQQIPHATLLTAIFVALFGIKFHHHHHCYYFCCCC